MRLNIDFLGQPGGLSSSGVILLTLAIAVAATVAGEGSEAYLKYRQSAQALAGARLQSKARVSTVPPNQIDAINRVTRQLNLPWQELFAAVESRLSDQVALLSLEPDASNRILRIQAEARSPDDMMDFVGSLEGENLFVSVNLTRHEINDSDRNRPYRFTLEAAWQTEY